MPAGAAADGIRIADRGSGAVLAGDLERARCVGDGEDGVGEDAGVFAAGVRANFQAKAVDEARGPDRARARAHARTRVADRERGAQVYEIWRIGGAMLRNLRRRLQARPIQKASRGSGDRRRDARAFGGRAVHEEFDKFTSRHVLGAGRSRPNA